MAPNTGLTVFYFVRLFFFFLIFRVKDTCAVEELEEQEKKTKEEREKRTKVMAKVAIQKLDKELESLHGNNDEQKLMRKDLVKKLAFTVQQTIKLIVDGKHPTEEMVKEFIDKRKPKPAATKSPNSQRSDDNRRKYVAAVLQACKAASACGDADCQEKSTQASFSDSH